MPGAPAANLAAANATTPYHLGLSLGFTMAEGSAPFGGGGALRVFGGARVAPALSLEVGLSYVDFFSRGPGTNAMAALALSVGVRFEVPLLRDWLRFYGYGGGLYGFGLSFFRADGAADQRDRVSGLGFTFGGGLRFRVWGSARLGTELFLGAELGSLWILPGGDAGPTVQNTISLPVSVSWR